MALPSTSYKGVKFVAAGWTAFILENVVVSSYREEIIQTYDKNTYFMIYNTLSTLACASIGYGYLRYGRKQGPTLTHSTAAKAFGFIVQSIGLVGLSQLPPKLQLPVAVAKDERDASLNDRDPTMKMKPFNEVFTLQLKCPMDFKAYNAPKDGSVHGIERVSRHPVFWSMGLACLGAAFRTPYLSEAVMYSFPSLFAFIGGEHMDHRHRNGSGGYLSPERDVETSNFPFLALLKGNQSWSALAEDMKWPNAAVAIAIAAKLAFRR